MPSSFTKNLKAVSGPRSQHFQAATRWQTHHPNYWRSAGSDHGRAGVMREQGTHPESNIQMLDIAV
jgi:hypothetical protein